MHAESLQVQPPKYHLARGASPQPVSPFTGSICVTRQSHALSHVTSHLLTLLGTPPRQTRLPPRLPVTLSKPLTRLDHLYHIDPLLDSHKGSRGKHADPRDRRVHLVGTSHLHGCGGERTGEEHGGFRSGRRTGLDGGWVVEVGEQGGREERGAEGEEVEGDEEHFVHEAEGEENFLSKLLVYALWPVLHTRYQWGRTYVVGVILLHQPTLALVHVLVALVAATHAQGRVHVHVVTGQIQRNKALEDDAEARESLRQEDEQAGCCTPVRYHV